MWGTSCLWVTLVLMAFSEINYIAGKENVHSRQKRMVWLADDGRLALPTGTKLTVDLTLSGFLSPMTIHLPLTIDFDALGWTDDQNPFGAFSSFIHSIGSMFSGPEEHRRSTRSANSTSKPRKNFKSSGLERLIFYPVVENILKNFGMNGKACLLRAICEVHSHNATVNKYGLTGKYLQSFLTADQSTSDGSMQEYTAAENMGKNDKKCQSYFKNCPKSLFSPTPKWSKKRHFDEIDNTSINSL